MSFTTILTESASVPILLHNINSETEHRPSGFSRPNIGSEQFAPFIDLVRSVASMSDRGSNWGAILARIDPSKTRPFLYVELYGISGIFLWLFGNRATWKAECQVLSQVRDDDAKQFKKSVLNECTMVSVAVSIRCTSWFYYV